ncbi:MAG: AAA family ATPase, partial [Blastocatellia bacterium]
MRIDRLTVQNFRKFEELAVDLHPQFTLLVGNNGSGKTTILDALAISLSVETLGQGQAIEPKDVRLTPAKIADRTHFQEQRPTSVKALGQIGTSNGLEWEQVFSTNGQWKFEDNLRQAFTQLRSGDQNLATWPLISYYGVTRASLPPNRPDALNMSLLNVARRTDAYLHWLNERIDYEDLRRWFYRETAAAGSNSGHKRPGYEAVRRAVLLCVPDANDLWFDVDYADPVCSIGGQAQPLSNLSDGQRMLLAMVADIAVKAVTLNAHLLPADKLGAEDEPIPRVLSQTPGVVLIDELDVHLHPSWQRRVAADLKRTFPAIQFVCSSHSPQVIGEVPPEQIRIIDGETVYSPEHSFGVDSSRILEEVM